MDLKNRIKGCFFGQAIGDAMGLQTEFLSDDKVKIHYPEICQLGERYGSQIREYIDKAYESSLSDLILSEDSSMGYTLKTLSAALGCYFHSPDFASGLLDVVNTGSDAQCNCSLWCAWCKIWFFGITKNVCR